MEFHYDITKQDYIDFNVNYFDNNAVVQRSIMMTRVAAAVIVLLGGSLLMYLIDRLSVFSTVFYAVLAVAVFFWVPWYMRRKVIKNVDRILKNARNQQLCGSKTLILRDEEFELMGENEDTVYRYDAVQRTASDAGHYFIFIDEFSAIIVPFTAFADDAQKQAFYDRISANIQDEALKC